MWSISILAKVKYYCLKVVGGWVLGGKGGWVLGGKGGWVLGGKSFN